MAVVRRRIVVRLRPGHAACDGRRRTRTRCRCCAPTSARPRSSPISPAACRCRTRTVSLYNEKPGQAAGRETAAAAGAAAAASGAGSEPAAAAAIADASAEASPAGGAGGRRAQPSGSAAAETARRAAAAPTPRLGRQPPAVQKALLPAATGAPAGEVQVRLGSLRTRKRPRGVAAAEARERRSARQSEGDRGVGRPRREGHYYRIMAGPLDEAAAERLCGDEGAQSRVHHCPVSDGTSPVSVARGHLLGSPASA